MRYLLATGEGKATKPVLVPVNAAILNYCDISPRRQLPYFIASEWGAVLFVPLESADKTPIYNLIGPLSSTLNDEKSCLTVHRRHRIMAV
jgi:hypothetical protein